MFDRQDHESSCLCQIGVLALLIGAVQVVTERRLRPPKEPCVYDKMLFSTDRSMIGLGWEAPHAQAASTTVGQFRPANSGRDEGLRPSGRPQKTCFQARGVEDRAKNQETMVLLRLECQL